MYKASHAGFQLLFLAPNLLLWTLLLDTGQGLGNPRSSFASQIPVGLCQRTVRPEEGEGAFSSCLLAVSGSAAQQVFHLSGGS